MPASSVPRPLLQPEGGDGKRCITVSAIRCRDEDSVPGWAATGPHTHTTATRIPARIGTARALLDRILPCVPERGAVVPGNAADSRRRAFAGYIDWILR